MKANILRSSYSLYKRRSTKRNQQRIDPRESCKVTCHLATVATCNVIGIKVVCSITRCKTPKVSTVKLKCSGRQIKRPIGHKILKCIRDDK